MVGRGMLEARLLMATVRTLAIIAHLKRVSDGLEGGEITAYCDADVGYIAL